jgi:Ca2+-binding EF-hand superfamily protein
MMRHTIPGLLLLCLTANVSADQPPRQAEPWAVPEVQDLVYLGEKRPVLFRLHLYLDGKPYSERWTEYLTRLFKYLDRDDNGTLDKEEVGWMPTIQHFNMLFQNAYQVGTNIWSPPFADVDADGDGKVTFEEFVQYYRGHGVYPVRLSGVPGAGTRSTMLTNLLFSVLDTNKDGKLSRSELEAAAIVLRKFDQDDDEMITAFELLNAGLNTAVVNQGVQVQTVNPRTGLSLPPKTSFVLVQQEEAGSRLGNRLRAAKAVLARYDHDKDGKLTQEELGFPMPLFDKLSPDGEGKVDAVKLLRWLLTLPDVELIFRVGKSADGSMPVEVMESQRQDVPMLEVRKASNGTAAMSFGKTTLNLVRIDNANGNQALNYSQFYIQQFRMLDKDKRGFITAKQLENPQYNYLKQIMKLADRNDDGKLTEEELIEFNEVMTGSVGVLTSLQYSDFGQGLFEMLDSNRDGRLGVRELRTAWSRLKEHDEDQDGCISKTELPRQCQLSVGKGAGVNYGNNLADQGGQPMRGTKPMAAGPLWFRKMDVNNDGDVSPREFLGSPEDFARIDTDGDGLISLEEAIKADAWFREKLTKKP